MDIGAIVAQIKALLAGARHHVMRQVKWENLKGFQRFQRRGTILLNIWRPAANNEDNVVDNSEADDSINVVARI